DEGVEVAPEGDTTTDGDVAVLLVVARRGALLPTVVFGRPLDGVAVARSGEIAEPEINRVGGGCRCDLVPDRLAAEQDRAPKRIADMRRAQRRRALHQRGNDLPAQAAMVEGIRGNRDFEDRGGMEARAEQMAGQHVAGSALAGIGVMA